MTRWLFVVSALFLPSFAQASSPNPWLAGVLAEVFPGAGYAYNGDWRSAALSTPLILPLAAPYYVTTPTFLSKSVKVNARAVARNVFGFSVYDSFQQALAAGEHEPLELELPRYSFGEMVLAPFDGRSYRDWRLWVPVGLAAIVAARAVLTSGVSPSLTPLHAALGIPAILAVSMIVGVGEEAEFRGFQYPAFAQLTRSRLVGNILQGLSFGVCHTRWGVCTSPYLTSQVFRATTTIDASMEYVAASSPGDGGRLSDWEYLAGAGLMGMFLGWTASSSEHGLLSAVTAHALYDAILITSDLLTTGGTGRIYLNIPVAQF